MGKIKKITVPLLLATVLIFIIILFFAAHLFLVPSAQYSGYQSKLSIQSASDTTGITEKERKSLEQKIVQLTRKTDHLTPGSAFLIINTTDNAFNLYKSNQLIRKGLCSTGSFIQLEVDSSKSFMFETPKGVLTVQNKITNPVWRKPDWAFIEEGLPVPPPNHPSRYEKGVLGDYALSLGDGYLIHGTLYQRFIGMPVTHGCVRLGDEDLEVIYNTMQVGSKVFIY